MLGVPACRPGLKARRLGPGVRRGLLDRSATVSARSPDQGDVPRTRSRLEDEGIDRGQRCR